MRLAFFTDLHHGGTAAGFMQQRRFLGGAPWVTAQLAERARDEHWDLLVLGGDLVEEATREQIDQATSLCRQIDCPTLVCLGNHDVNRADAVTHWHAALRCWPHARLADARADFADATILALNNPWLDALGTGRLYWEPGSNPLPTLLPAHLAWLDTELSRGTGPAILCIHCPTHAIPPEQTGLATPIHESPAAYGDLLHSLLNRHPRAKLVLSGHNHVSCATTIHNRLHASVSAVGEVPYQYVTVDVDGSSLTMKTRTLGTPPGGPALDPAKPWVTGRPADRAFTTPR
jgi:3',5'-cyclic AMP phosphodiesterase CpdA